MLDQKARENWYFKVPVFVTDSIIQIGILYLLLHYLPEPYLNGLESPAIRYGVYVLYFVAFIISIAIFDLKIHERRIKVSRVIERAIFITAVSAAIFFFLTVLVYKISPRTVLVLQFGASAVLISLWHYVANVGVRYLRKIGHNTRQTVIIGTDKTALRLFEELNYGQDVSGYRIRGFFTEDEKLVPQGAEYLGNVQESIDWIRNNHPDEVYCSLSPALHQEDVNSIIKACNDSFASFYFVPNMDGYPHRHMEYTDFGSVTIIKLRPEPLNSAMAKMGKRSFDILVSLLFLCTIYPFVVLFVLLGNLLGGNRGPLYFRQNRTGYNGKSFRIYKFRSMRQNAQADTLQATENDPRKTPFGDFLRRSSIDELPQMINVLKGEMSLVGPRPHMEYHTEKYSELIGNYMVRHLAKPGITGWAQINGCRGETKTVEEMAARVEYDIWYIEHWTILLDMKILIKTAWQVLPGHDRQAY